MTVKVVLVLVLVTSVVAAEKGAWWVGSNPGLFEGKKDEFPDENGNVDGKRFFVLLL